MKETELITELQEELISNCVTTRTNAYFSTDQSTQTKANTQGQLKAFRICLDLIQKILDKQENKTRNNE